MIHKGMFVAQVFFMLCVAIAHVDRASAADRTPALLHALDEVRAETIENSRVEKARELTVLIKDTVTRNGLAPVDQSLIDGLIELLDDESDAVRLWTAGSLGLIGPEAKSAVPALHIALSKIEAEEDANKNVVLPKPDSRDAIQTAIERITGHRPGPMMRKRNR